MGIECRGFSAQGARRERLNFCHKCGKTRFVMAHRSLYDEMSRVANIAPGYPIAAGALKDRMAKQMTTGQYADRRSGQDRRRVQQFRPGPERRSGFDRRSTAESGILALRGTDVRQEGAGREKAGWP